MTIDQENKVVDFRDTAGFSLSVIVHARELINAPNQFPPYDWKAIIKPEQLERLCAVVAATSNDCLYDRFFNETGHSFGGFNWEVG